MKVNLHPGKVEFGISLNKDECLSDSPFIPYISFIFLNMIWANNLGILQYYLIGAFLLAYVLYQVRIFLITRKKNEVSPGNILKKFVLRSVYFSLIIIAMLGPSFGDIKKELKSEGKDIYILLDVSSSMKAYDIPPSRLEKAKKELKYILKNLRYNDRVGLIVFANEPYLQCPLTFDFEAINLFLDAASPDLVISQGTNFANALDFASEKFSTNTKSAIPSKVILLVSDGEGSDQEAYNSAVKLKNNNISLFILGIGTEKGSKIPIHPGFKRDKFGKYVVTRINKEALTRIAGVNGENYYGIGRNFTQSSALIDKLNSLEGTVKEVRKIDLSSNKYYYFLAIALFFIIIDGLMTVNIIKI